MSLAYDLWNACSVDEHDRVVLLLLFTASLTVGIVSRALRARWTSIALGANGRPGRLFIGTYDALHDGSRRNQGLEPLVLDVVKRMNAPRNVQDYGFTWSYRPAMAMLATLFSLLPGGRFNAGHVATLAGTRRGQLVTDKFNKTAPGGATRSGYASLYTWFKSSADKSDLEQPRPWSYDRQRVQLCDGASVFLDWLQPRAVGSEGSYEPVIIDEPERPVLVVLHGICGGSSEDYVQHIMVRAYNEGNFRPVCFNFRGAYNTPLDKPYGYSAGQTHDLREVVAAVHERYPLAPICLTGFSLGANILTKFLGEEGGLFSESCSHVHPSPEEKSAEESEDLPSHGHDQGRHHGNGTPTLPHGIHIPKNHPEEHAFRPFLAGAVAISNLYDLEKSSAFIHTNKMGRVYSKHIASNLRNFVSRHEGRFRELMDAPEQQERLKFSAPVSFSDVMQHGNTIREFDELVIRRMFGFDSVDEYYRRCSGNAFLSHVNVPLLSISALDDPLVAPDGIPIDKMTELPWPAKAETAEEGNDAFPPPSELPHVSCARVGPSNCVALALTHTGGHVSWIENETRAWSDAAALSFLTSAVEKWAEMRAIDTLPDFDVSWTEMAMGEG